MGNDTAAKSLGPREVDEDGNPLPISFKRGMPVASIVPVIPKQPRLPQAPRSRDD